ncbi:MAG: beta-ketoacyl-[acyl-carrier-protein] synthase family protein [Planctomycetaceae bacterium]|nr:beta-ketoacyl-[acyl-carrier-protein] synthase family protein [Planctomycetaceae bacterium]
MTLEEIKLKRNMSAFRTVITGIGLVTPFGSTLESLWTGLYSGANAIALLPEELTQLSEVIRFGSYCHEFSGDIENFGELEKELKRNIRKSAKIMCRETQMAVACAQKALSDASLHFTEPQRRVGMMYGSDYMLSEPEATFGAYAASRDENGEFDIRNMGSRGKEKVAPLWLLVWLPNMPACHISILNQFLGPNDSLTMNESSANATLKYAHETIARGWADIMITGATGTRLQSIRTWQVAISEQLAPKDADPETVCCPFDKRHSGQVLGEGAGTFILESLSHAQERGAKIYAEFLAGADTMVGTHTPDLEKFNLVPNYRQGFVNVLKKVLADSGKTVDQIGFIHAHGLGVPEVDRAEAEAIREVFAERSTPIPVVAAKAAFGNLGAGAGAIELAAGIEALRKGVLFPTRNFQEADEGCELNIVTDCETPAGDCFINLSTNFQGQTSAALLGAYRD